MSTTAKSPVEIADNFRRQLIETTRRTIAMRRHFSGAICRWRRAAPMGPNAELAVVLLWRPGQPPETELWPYAKIERLAEAITDEEVFDEMAKHLSPAVAGDSEPAS